MCNDTSLTRSHDVHQRRNEKQRSKQTEKKANKQKSELDPHNKVTAHFNDTKAILQRNASTHELIRLAFVDLCQTFIFQMAAHISLYNIPIKFLCTIFYKEVFP